MRHGQIGMIMNAPEVSAERHPEHEDRLDIARALFEAIAAHFPRTSIILCDGDGLVVGYTHDAQSAS
jgi:hypothetical protein